MRGNGTLGANAPHLDWKKLYIDTGDADQNASLLAKLGANKDAIEDAFGAPLTWEPLPGKRACRVAVYRDGDVLRIDDHDAYVDWFLDTSGKLRAAVESFMRAGP